MKYYVENDLSLFEFHDANFSFVDFDGTDLTVSASAVNIHKNTPQNTSDYDMEIESAWITFRNFHAATYDLGRIWEPCGDGNYRPVTPPTIFRGEEAMARILGELRHEMWVYHLVKDENGRYSLGGCGEEPYFEIEFDCENILICWDAYTQKAWYELHRQYRYDLVLQTPRGEETVQLLVSCHETEVYIKGVRLEPPVVCAGCKYEGKDYWGHGSDYLWIDAFAHLQNQLPEGVSLKCCLTCRHGNLCPVGNDINSLFCTKDVRIQQKSDLYFYTEDPGERVRRSSQYCSLCDDYQPQTDAYYTYNDFPDFLKRG